MASPIKKFAINAKAALKKQPVNLAHPPSAGTPTTTPTTPSATPSAPKKYTLKLPTKTMPKAAPKGGAVFAHKASATRPPVKRIRTNSSPGQIAPQNQPFPSPPPEKANESAPDPIHGTVTATIPDSLHTEPSVKPTESAPQKPTLKCTCPESNLGKEHLTDCPQYIDLNTEGLRAKIDEHGETTEILPIQQDQTNEGIRADKNTVQTVESITNSTIEQTQDQAKQQPQVLEKGTSRSMPKPGENVSTDGRRTNGGHLTSTLASELGKKSAKKRSFYAQNRVPPLRCDACTFSAQCPNFKTGYECAFGDLLNGIKITSLTDIADFQNALLEADIQRVQFGLITERISGGTIDPNVSARMDSAYAKLKALRDQHLQSQASALQRPIDSVTVTASATGAPASIFQQLFGQFTPAPKAETPITELKQACPPPLPPSPAMVVEEINQSKRSEISELIGKLP